ncbi:RHS repeat-associated core domain-containing protein, partial [Pseudomonas cichorii]|uniref:RHS repeat-associated core domain-containing protein n=1 Tax=Pseudomonas cichorii TaxID=36746 RepID=UPI00287BAE36
NDHLGSNTLELDQQGNLISQESYYPFGGTAWWAARSAVEAKYKTVRYSGKERDASGLYYYGFRYYAPWLQRWINPDPAGNVNGLNLFSFVANAPITHTDVDGRVYEGKDDISERIMEVFGHNIYFRGLSEFPHDQRQILKDALKKDNNIYEHALYMIKFHPEETTRTMRSFFGYQHEKVTRSVIEAWEDTYLRTFEYGGELGERKFIGIRSTTYKAQALVYKEDPHGRVAVDLDDMDEKDLHLVLGHELTHLKNVSGSTIKGPDSKDYYYLFERHISKLIGGGNTTNQPPHQAVAEVITGGGLNLEYFSLFDQLSENFINRLKSLHSNPDSIIDLNSAINEFNRNPDIAAEMSAHNADSLMFSAYSLHKLYKKNFSQQSRGQQ